MSRATEQVRRGRRWLVVAAMLCGTAATLAQDAPLIDTSGYYKNLLVGSRTWTGERFTLDLNRLRLAVKGELSPRLRFDLQYDNELLLGDYLRTQQFIAQKDAPSPQYWQLDANYTESPRSYGRHRLYRASVNLSLGDTDIRLGRQRIAWGTGRFWSPLDMLNPINPATLEREERLGVDAVLVEHKLGPVSRVGAVHAPAPRGGRASTAMQWHGNVSSLDYSLVAGRLAGHRAIGLDLAGQIGQAGIRAELARFEPPQGRRFTRWLVGVDYAFQNTLTLTAEAYYNGAGASSPAGYDLPGQATGRTLSLGRRYVGVHASYEITPLLKASGDLVLNTSDRSRYVFAGLTYSLRTNLELSGGVQRFSGSAQSEFARVPDTWHLALQKYF